MTRRHPKLLLCAATVLAFACESPKPGLVEGDGVKADGARPSGDDAPTSPDAVKPDDACAGITMPSVEGVFAPEGSAQLLAMGQVEGATYKNKAKPGTYETHQLVIEGMHKSPSKGGGTNQVVVTYTQMFMPNMTALEADEAQANIEKVQAMVAKSGGAELMSSPIVLGGAKVPGYAFHEGNRAELNVWAPIAGSSMHQLVKLELSARLNAQCDAKVGEWAKVFFAKVAPNPKSTFTSLAAVKKALE